MLRSSWSLELCLELADLLVLQQVEGNHLAKGKTGQQYEHRFGYNKISQLIKISVTQTMMFLERAH